MTSACKIKMTNSFDPAKKYKDQEEVFVGGAKLRALK